MSEFQWLLKGRCYKLGHDVPHPGGVIPNWLIAGRYLDPKDVPRDLDDRGGEGLPPELAAELAGLGLR